MEGGYICSYIRYSNMKKTIPSLSVLMFALLLMSCGGNEPAVASLESLEEIFANFNNTPTFDQAGFYFSILEQGDGDAVSIDDFALVSQITYSSEGIQTGSTGSLPAAVALDIQAAAISESLTKLNEGGSIRVFVPPLSGDAAQTAVFDLEVEGLYDDVEDFNTSVIEEYVAAENLNTIISEEGLYYAIDVVGEGENPVADSRVSVIYEGFFLNGDVFDSSNGNPITFGLREVIEGWTLGIPLLKPGGSATLILPSGLAYGEVGNTGIPPNYPIAFRVELLEVFN